MNFNEWYKSYFTLEERMTSPVLKAEYSMVWNVCKEEVLKILKENSKIECIESGEENVDDIQFDYISPEVIKKIEKL